MARKRAFKKRVDYRAGGRVSLQAGSSVPQSGGAKWDFAIGRRDSTKNLPDAPGTVESGEINPADFDIAKKIREQKKAEGQQSKLREKAGDLIGLDPGDALTLGSSSQEGTTTGSGYDQTGYADEVEAGSSIQSEVPPKPNVDDYQNYNQWRLAVAEWESRYGEGEKSNEGVKKDRDEELFESVTGASSASGTTAMGSQTGNTTMALDQDARAKRIAKTTEQIQDQYSGTLPEGAKIKDIGSPGTEVDPNIAAETKQITGDFTTAQRQAGTTRVADVTKVTDVSQADDPTQLTAKGYTAATAGTLDPTQAAHSKGQSGYPRYSSRTNSFSRYNRF